MNSKQYKTVYGYRQESGELVSATYAAPCPFRAGKWNYPAHTTDIEPPHLKDRQAACFDTENKKWRIVADLRKVKLWQTDNAQPIQAKLGDTLASLHATELEPPAYPKWDGEKWAIDEEAKRQNDILEAKNQIAALRYKADYAIAPLQDAVDLGVARADEQAKLTEWKQYRVALSRIPQQQSYPYTIDWPESPQ